MRNVSSIAIQLHSDHVLDSVVVVQSVQTDSISPWTCIEECLLSTIVRQKGKADVSVE